MVSGKGSERMGGGGTKVKQVEAQYAKATPEQNQLMGNQMDWFANLGPSINSLTNLGNSSLSNIPSFNYGQMFNDNMGQQSQIQSGFNGLAQGKLPDGWANEQAKAIERSMGNALGSTMAKWADKGLVNSSLSQKAFGDVSTQAANQLQQNYLNNLSAAGSALGNSMTALWNPMQQAQSAEQAAWQTPANAFGLAGQLNQPISDLLSQLLQQQTSLSSPAQTIVQQKSSPWGAIGGLAGQLGSAAIMCFPAGTLIDMPKGEVPIEAVREMDVVYGDDFQDEVVVQTYQGTKPELFVIVTNKGTLRTTEGQRLMLPDDELERVENLKVGDKLIHRDSYAEIEAIEKEIGEVAVYELDVTGHNLFWADGFLVEGMVESWA